MAVLKLFKMTAVQDRLVVISCSITMVFHKFTTYKFIYQRLYGKILAKVFQKRRVLVREEG
jgi:hypothetical protein